MNYDKEGFCLIKGAVPTQVLDTLEARIIGLVREWTGIDYGTTISVEFTNALSNDRELERRLYDRVRDFDWLQTFSLAPEITSPVKAILGNEIGLMSKIPLRLDVPEIVREIAVWHQDYWYVKGNTEIVTAWIPLQDTSYAEGCLMVMPGSHKLGPLDHDTTILAKRHYPSGIFDREVRYVEMKRGDLLLFNALLLHSSGINISNRTRLSVQARFSRLDAPTDESMGRVISIN
jgi:ectoine hydroxylase-related dioxygenase (phytanoyl-CoA dioxygenase family)